MIGANRRARRGRNRGDAEEIGDGVGGGGERVAGKSVFGERR